MSLLCAAGSSANRDSSNLEIQINIKEAINNKLPRFKGTSLRAQELRGSRGGRSGLPVSNKPDGFCGRKATLKRNGTSLLRYEWKIIPTVLATGEKIVFRCKEFLRLKVPLN